jgi:hypothetical protein
VIAQLPLTHVIVHARSTVFEKAAEFFTWIVGIGDRRAQRTARIDVGVVAVEPVIEKLQVESRELRGLMRFIGGAGRLESRWTRGAACASADAASWLPEARSQAWAARRDPARASPSFCLLRSLRALLGFNGLQYGSEIDDAKSAARGV